MRRPNIFAWFALAVLAGPAGAYYHYVHYTSRTAPYLPVTEKFDLSVLPNKTVTFFVSDQGPIIYSPNDNFASVLSQVAEAARTWNTVSTSDLRVAFGGLITAGTTQLTPGGDVVFEELPPGVLGLGGPTVRGDISAGASGSFVPIIRAAVHLNRDLTQAPGPSYSEAFFRTVLHEMGHALGLQHTLTSSAMATDETRGTSRANPLEDDDIAGLSLLYPTRAFASQFGSISGRVTIGGQGVHLASVVAVRTGGTAISALTNPDGTYRIDGLPQGLYMVYAHPLPPATQTGFGRANLVLPVGPDGRPVAEGDSFDTVFFPGTKDVSSLQPVGVTAGASADNVNFSVQRRNSPAVYGVRTYSYYDPIYVKPAYLNVLPGIGTVVAYGAGLAVNNNVAPGLGVGALDGSVVFSPGSFRAFGTPAFLAFDLLFNFVSGTGPRHLAFFSQNDVYVLPSALRLVQNPPPAILAATPGVDATGARVVNLAGRSLTSDTRYYFNGAPATVRSFDASAQQAVVTPPPAPGGYRAIITAVAPDGQTSMFVQSQTPPAYTYDPGDVPTVFYSVPGLPAGSEGLVEIYGANTNFTDGQTMVGFGSSDIVVRRVFVAAPNYALANVAVLAGAQLGATQASVVSGLQVSSAPFGFQVLPGNPRLPQLRTEVLNAATGLPGLYPGASGVLTGSNLSAAGLTPLVTLRDMAGSRDIPVAVLSFSPVQVTFQIPAGFALGPTVLKLNNGTEAALPIAILVDQPPPVVVSALNGANEVLDATRAVRSGEPVNLLLSGMGDAGKDISLNRIRVDIGGVSHVVLQGFWQPAPGGLYQAQVILSSQVEPGAQVPLTVSLDDRVSRPYFIAIRQ